jgi:hypothetical protein
MAVQITPGSQMEILPDLGLFQHLFNSNNLPTSFYPETANRRLEDVNTVFK